jgi:transcriptional regulator with XRE-family HTH domain
VIYDNVARRHMEMSRRTTQNGEVVSMPDAPGSTVPRRRLGRELLQLRNRSGLKVEEVAARMRCSRSKVWRIESGRTPVRAVDVEKLCRIYGAPAKLHKALVALAGETAKPGWWHSYGDVIPEWFEVYVDLESSASAMQIYEPELVTGLLQLHNYAYAVLRTADVDEDEEEIERRVSVRLGRQVLLGRKEPPQLEVILNEAVVRRPVGGRAPMALQLRHLATLENPSISVRVLPFAAGVHAAMMGSFTYLQFAERSEPDVIYHETRTGALYLDKPAERKPYRQMWRDIDQRALDVEASRKFIMEAAKELET